jgi:hypothetical protein
MPKRSHQILVGRLTLWKIAESYRKGGWLHQAVEMGDFFTLVSMKLPYSCQKAKISLCKSVFFTNNHLFSSIINIHVKCSWNLTHTGFDIQCFIPNLFIISFFKIVDATCLFCERQDMWWSRKKLKHFASF